MCDTSEAEAGPSKWAGMRDACVEGRGSSSCASVVQKSDKAINS